MILQPEICCPPHATKHLQSNPWSQARHYMILHLPLWLYRFPLLIYIYIYGLTLDFMHPPHNPFGGSKLYSSFESTFDVPSDLMSFPRKPLPHKTSKKMNDFFSLAKQLHEVVDVLGQGEAIKQQQLIVRASSIGVEDLLLSSSRCFRSIGRPGQRVRAPTLRTAVAPGQHDYQLQCGSLTVFGRTTSLQSRLY